MKQAGWALRAAKKYGPKSLRLCDAAAQPRGEQGPA